MGALHKLTKFGRQCCRVIGIMLLAWYALMVVMAAYFLRDDIRQGHEPIHSVFVLPVQTAWDVASVINRRMDIAAMTPFAPYWAPQPQQEVPPIISDSLAAKWPGSPQWPVESWTRLPPGMAVPSPATLAGKVVVIYCFQHW